MLRSTPEGELQEISPLLNAVNYEFVRKFDRLEDISRLDIPGLKYLEFDAVFSLYHLKSPTRHDVENLEIASPLGSTNQVIGERMARTVHAPGLMIVPVPAEARVVTGWYGFPARTDTGTPWTDGAEFLIYWFDGEKRELIFQRALRPDGNPNEQDLQFYELKLPQALPGHKGRLIYETTTLETPSYDWTSWTPPEFQP